PSSVFLARQAEFLQEYNIDVMNLGNFEYTHSVTGSTYKFTESDDTFTVNREPGDHSVALRVTIDDTGVQTRYFQPEDETSSSFSRTETLSNGNVRVTRGSGDNRVVTTQDRNGNVIERKYVGEQNGDLRTITVRGNQVFDDSDTPIDGFTVRNGHIMCQGRGDDCDRKRRDQLRETLQTAQRAQQNDIDLNAMNRISVQRQEGRGPFGMFEQGGTFARMTVDLEYYSTIARNVGQIAYWFGDDAFGGWQQSVTRIFREATTAGVVDRICEAKFDSPPQQTAFIRVPDSVTGMKITPVATVGAQCSLPIPIYNETTGDIIREERLYKMTAFVKNPSTDELENGSVSQIEFQIEFRGDQRTFNVFEGMYPLKGGDVFSLNFRNPFVRYSPNVYNEVCIVLSSGLNLFNGGNEICNEIICEVPPEQGYSIPELEDESDGDSQPSTGDTTPGFNPGDF
ncbi:MAG: hypothetical protein ACMXYF_04350, partial [Candidatus Woesearchaeota archaeon]